MGKGESKVSEVGIFGAMGLSLFATIGHTLTNEQCCDRYNWIWLSLFGISVLILSGAVVNFDPKRWLR